MLSRKAHGLRARKSDGIATQELGNLVAQPARELGMGLYAGLGDVGDGCRLLTHYDWRCVSKICSTPTRAHMGGLKSFAAGGLHGLGTKDGGMELEPRNVGEL